MNGNIIPYGGGLDSEIVLTDSGGNQLIAKRRQGFVELYFWNFKMGALSGFTLPEKYRPPHTVDGCGWMWTITPDTTYSCQIRIYSNGTINTWGRVADGSNLTGDNYRIFGTIIYMV